MYLAIDPGAGNIDSIGLAVFYNTGDLMDMRQCTFKQFVDCLDSLVDIHQVICEDYVIWNKKAKAHIGSRVETAQTIGALRGWAMSNGNIPIEFQESSILKPAEKLFQIQMPADHRVSHQFSALLHGMWNLYHKGLIKSALEKELEAKKKEKMQG